MLPGKTLQYMEKFYESTVIRFKNSIFQHEKRNNGCS